MEDNVERSIIEAEGEAVEQFEFVNEGEFEDDDQDDQNVFDDLKNNIMTDIGHRNDNNLVNTYKRHPITLRNNASISTPDTKLTGTQFSSGREGRGNSVQINYKRKRMSDRHDMDGNETFITSTDYHQQMTAMDDRVSKLENLVWSLYRELNGKIETSFANTQLQSTDVAEKVVGQLGSEIQELRETMVHLQNSVHLMNPQNKVSDDDGYEGSDENQDEPNQACEANYDPQNFQVQLDEVMEEQESSQYDSNLERENIKYDYANRSNPEIQIEQEFDLDQLNKFKANKFSNKKSFQDKLSNSEENSTPEAELEVEDENNELEYYFSCHERMIREYNNDTQSDVFVDINKDELRDNFTMPDLSRSTLVDQIDYSLDNYKINESSVFDSSTEDAFKSKKSVN